MLDTYGRVEVLWFPFNSNCFAQCSQRVSAQGNSPVTGPYNYPWMNSVSSTENAGIAAWLHKNPEQTPVFTRGELAIATQNQNGVVLSGQARDLAIYLKDTTLRVTLAGWALQLPRSEVQGAASAFFTKVQSMLMEAAQDKVSPSYPINAAMELRCDTMDESLGLAITYPSPPALAATRSATPGDAALDTVFWLNVGTITGTPGSDAFYTDLEKWLLDTYASYVRPEWSKAWAFTPAGPWTNQAVLAQYRGLYNDPSMAPHTLKWVNSTLSGYDRAGLFTSPLLAQLFGA